MFTEPCTQHAQALMSLHVPTLSWPLDGGFSAKRNTCEQSYSSFHNYGKKLKFEIYVRYRHCDTFSCFDFYQSSLVRFTLWQACSVFVNKHYTCMQCLMCHAFFLYFGFPLVYLSLTRQYFASVHIYNGDMNPFWKWVLFYHWILGAV